MALDAGGSCVKYLIFFFNLIFAVTGLIILGVGIWALTQMSHYLEWLDIGVVTSPLVYVLVGLLIFVISFLGCCGAAKESYCMIITFSILLVGVLVGEVGLGVAGYVKHSALEQHLGERLNNSLANYHSDKHIEKIFNMMQTELRCCGVNGPGDWQSAIPESCCSDGLRIDVDGDGTEACTQRSEHLHRQGCFPKLLALFSDNALTVGGFCLGVAIVQLLGIALACYLSCSIKHGYHTV